MRRGVIFLKSHGRAGRWICILCPRPICRVAVLYAESNRPLFVITRLVRVIHSDRAYKVDHPNQSGNDNNEAPSVPLFLE